MIILLGASGYVGEAFKLHLAELKVPVCELSARDVLAEGKIALGAKLRDLRPDFLINAAGFTGKPNVDTCENFKAETLTGNVSFPLMLGEVCAAEGIPWGHVSSGCIYQGVRGTDKEGKPLGFREDDAPNFDFNHPPCSFYSGTKSLAEQLLAAFPSLYIWRLRVPFDEKDGARNYLSKLMRYSRLLEVRNSLSHRADFVRSCWATYTRQLPYGTYNLTNHQSVTTREVVGLIEAEGHRRRLAGDKASAERMSKSYEFFASEDEFMQQAARSPRSSCVLDTDKALRTQLPMRDIHTALTESLRQWQWEKA